MVGNNAEAAIGTYLLNEMFSIFGNHDRFHLHKGTTRLIHWTLFADM